MDELGPSYKETVNTLAQFLEVVFHTILCIRGVYPVTSFTRRRAFGVAVYQNRHPDVRKYVADAVAELARLMESGDLQRVTLSISAVATRLHLERFIFDFGYMSTDGLDPNAKIRNAPTDDALRLMLRAFLIRLTALDSQLEDISTESTFAIIIHTKNNTQPGSDWVGALASETIPLEGHHEPLLSVRAVETGVIDECTGKTGVDHLRVSS